jgi:hypothetical protein
VLFEAGQVPAAVALTHRSTGTAVLPSCRAWPAAGLPAVALPLAMRSMRERGPSAHEAEGPSFGVSRVRVRSGRTRLAWRRPRMPPTPPA